MSEVLAKYNEDGQPIDDISFRARAGFESTRRFTVKNIHAYPIVLRNPTPTNKEITVLSYPTTVLRPGDSGIVEIQYNAPASENSLIEGTVVFDTDIVAIG